MPARHRSRFWNGLAFVLAALACGLAASGCGSSGTPPPQSDGEKNLQALGNAIAMFQGAKKRYPNDLNELKAWLKTAKASDLKARGIEDVEKIFTSPRDSQPYLYAKPISSIPPALAYEKTGASDKKMVVGHHLIVEDVQEADLQARLKESKIRTPVEP